MQHAKPQEPARVAVYDFDNTSLDCSSTVRLVFYLLRSSYLSLGTSLKIGFWGIAYKLRLPQNESWVRGQVFKAFDGRPKARVDQFLAKYYDEVLEKHFRPAAHASMHEYMADGVDVLMVSASFEPLVLRAMQRHGFTGQVSTRMKVAPDGTYTREVDGLPVEGAEKIEAIKRWCDEQYGEGQWRIVAAFGDHHSDEAMLACAEQSFAVNPNSLLEKIAKERGWTILDWDAKDDSAPAEVSADDRKVGRHAGTAFVDVGKYESKAYESWPEVDEIGPDEFPLEDDGVAVEWEAVPFPGQSGAITYAKPSTRDARGVVVSPKRPGMMSDLTEKVPLAAAVADRISKVAAKVEGEEEPVIEAEPEPEPESEPEAESEPKLEPAPEPEPEPEPEPKGPVAPVVAPAGVPQTTYVPPEPTFEAQAEDAAGPAGM